MKTKTLTIFCFFLFILQTITLISCKKTNEAFSDAASNNVEKTKIIDWLKSQESDKTPVKNKSIESLSKNLSFAGLSYADYNTEERKIIIPINSGFISNNNKGKNPINVLLLSTDKLTGQISKAEIVQFIPASNAGNYDLKDIFLELSTEKKIQANGTFTFLSIGDVFVFEKEYKNGNLFSYKIMTSKPATDTQRDNLYCTHWYILTTYYYADGHEEYEITDLGITCSSCAPNQLCDHLDDDGGGGIDPNPGETKTIKPLLTIHHEGQYLEDWEVLVEITIKGQKFTAPQDNYFTSASPGSPGSQNHNAAAGGLNGWEQATTYCIYSANGLSASAGLSNSKTAVASGHVDVVYPNWQSVYGYVREGHFNNSQSWNAETDLQ